MSAGTGCLWAEGGGTGADGNTVLYGPRDCLFIVTAGNNIIKAVQRFRFGRTRRAPQESDDLRTSAGRVGTK